MMDKILLIIGASSDIGISLINSLEEEYLVLAHHRNSSTELMNKIENRRSKIIPIKANLHNIIEVREMIAFIKDNYGIPNYIVHLASKKFDNIRFKELTWERLQNEINVGLRSAFIVASSFLPLIKKEDQAKVIFMLSSATINTPPKALAHYTINKYALLGMMKSLASEFDNKNIQINAISPSMVDTKFLDNINKKIIELNQYNHPLKRIANKQDIVPLILFLLSDNSSYISGINIPVTGGSIF